MHCYCGSSKSLTAEFPKPECISKIVKSLKQEKDYSWDFVFNGEDYDLLFDYRIKTFPVFLLLDEDGKVVEYPAYKPSEVIYKTFDQLLDRK